MVRPGSWESEQVQGGPRRQAWGSQPPPDCSLLPEASSVCIEVRRSITSHVEGLSNTGRMNLLPIQNFFPSRVMCKPQGFVVTMPVSSSIA